MPTNNAISFTHVITAMSALVGREVLVGVGSWAADAEIISVEGVLQADAEEEEFFSYRLVAASGQVIGGFAIEEGLLQEARLSSADPETGLPLGVELNLANVTLSVYPLPQSATG